MSAPDRRRQWNANAPAWTELARGGFDLYRDLVNTPAFFSLLPPLDGLRCLDLGCGEGHHTRLVATRGADVVGLDLAERFIEAAARASAPAIPYVVGDGATLPFRDATFDAVTAFMSLMDTADPEAVLVEVARVLRTGGFFQFSVPHPATTTRTRYWINDAGGTRHALATGDYFYEGPITETWTFKTAPPELRDRFAPFEITYARRTLSGWVDAVRNAGLVIDAVAEPSADEATAAAEPEVADTRIVPFFLIIRSRKR